MPADCACGHAPSISASKAVEEKTSTVAGRPVLRIYHYERAGSPCYDSILRATSSPSNIVQEVPNVSHELRLGVWNLFGAASAEKRMIIDEMVTQQKSDNSMHTGVSFVCPKH